MAEKKSSKFTGRDKLFLLIASPIGVPVVILMFFVYYIPSFAFRVYQRVQEKLSKEEEND